MGLLLRRSAVEIRSTCHECASFCLTCALVQARLQHHAVLVVVAVVVVVVVVVGVVVVVVVEVRLPHHVFWVCTSRCSVKSACRLAVLFESLLLFLPVSFAAAAVVAVALLSA